MICAHAEWADKNSITTLVGYFLLHMYPLFNLLTIILKHIFILFLVVLCFNCKL